MESSVAYGVSNFDTFFKKCTIILLQQVVLDADYFSYQNVLILNQEC